MDELVAFVRQQVDAEGEALESDLVGYLGTHLEHDFRFRLADVEAKRRILDLHALYADAQFPDHDGGYASATEDVIQLLAQPYAGREGWREEWRSVAA